MKFASYLLSASLLLTPAFAAEHEAAVHAVDTLGIDIIAESMADMMEGYSSDIKLDTKWLDEAKPALVQAFEKDFTDKELKELDEINTKHDLGKLTKKSMIVSKKIINVISDPTEAVAPVQLSPSYQALIEKKMAKVRMLLKMKAVLENSSDSSTKQLNEAIERVVESLPRVISETFTEDEYRAISKLEKTALFKKLEKTSEKVLAPIMERHMSLETS